jgi:hypothetical protein
MIHMSAAAEAGAQDQESVPRDNPRADA